MKAQTELQRANLRSFVEVSEVKPFGEYLNFCVENKGNSNITDLHCWLHIEDSTAKFESVSSKLSEQSGLDVHQEPIPVEKEHSGWPESGDPYSIVIEPGESVKLRCHPILKNDRGHGVTLSQIIKEASNITDLEYFSIHLSLIYKDATGESQSERIMGLATFGPPDCENLTECFESMSHGVLLPEDKALEEYRERSNS